MRTVVYCILAMLAVAHCCVSQYTLHQFVDGVRSETLIPSMQAVGDLASNNATLNDRIERARLAVELISEENARLKASLKEGVEMLKDEIEENNKLNREIENLSWRISVLEQTIEMLKSPKEKTDEVSPP